MINSAAELLGITLNANNEMVLTIMVMALVICLSYKFLDFLFMLIGSFFSNDKIRF